MYVDNGKISNRQTFRLYVFDLMGIATLLLPPYLAKLCGAEGIWAILLGTAAGFLYLFYLGFIMGRMKKDACGYLRENTKGFLRFLTYIWVLFHSIVTAGFCSYIFANLMQYSLVQESKYWVILLVILLGAIYAVSGGQESRARIYEVLFWFVLIPYVVMICAAIRDFEPLYLEGILEVPEKGFLEGAYLVFLLLTPLFYSVFLVGKKEESYGKSMVKTVSVSILVTAGILLGSYILLLGNFGAKALSTMRFPVVTVMSTVQFQGNFLKRMDALMLAVWFFTLYALLNLHLHHGAEMLREISLEVQAFSQKKKQEESETKTQKDIKLWQIFLLGVLIFLLGVGMEYSAKWLWLFLDYYAYVAVPFMVILPGLWLLCGKNRN